MSTDEIVTVGEFLAVIEEALPGPGTYEHDGKIFAMYNGIKKLDKDNLEVSVEAFKRKKDYLPQMGDTVIAEVIMTRPQTAICRIFKVNDLLLFNSEMGLLHVSNMSQDYMPSVEEGFMRTDIIRAEIIGKDEFEYKITTRGKRFGVIHAECRNCGTVLVKQGRSLECNMCRFPNERKIAGDYGRVREPISNL